MLPVRNEVYGAVSPVNSNGRDPVRSKNPIEKNTAPMLPKNNSGRKSRIALRSVEGTYQRTYRYYWRCANGQIRGHPGPEANLIEPDAVGCQRDRRLLGIVERAVDIHLQGRVAEYKARKPHDESVM